MASVAAIARSLGASQMFASETGSYRGRLARIMGATLVFDLAEGDIVARIKEMTGGISADVVLEGPGNPPVLVDGLASLRVGGICSLGGSSRTR